MENQTIMFMRDHVIDELTILADLYRRKSKYKKYSKGMKSAFKNRACGIERAISTIDSYCRSEVDVDDEDSAIKGQSL